MNEPKRWNQIDHIKAVLIFCVVLGHLCEVTPFRGSGVIYLLIYSFHMPAFAFVSGLCCGQTYRPDKIVQNYGYPYVVFQLAYLLFCQFVLNNGAALQFTTPYWLLWYLMAMISWQIALPFFQTSSRRKQLVLLCLSVLVALLAGYHDGVSYFLSLSRTVVMFPFFLAGHYLNRPLGCLFQQMGAGQNRGRIALLRGAALLAAAGTAVALYRSRDVIEATWLYHVEPYSALGYTPLIRLCLLLAGAALIAFLCLFAPGRRLPLVAYVGRNTMPIFLLHGFAIQLLRQSTGWAALPHPAGRAMLAALLLVLICSSPPVVALLSPLMRYPAPNKRPRD